MTTKKDKAKQEFIEACDKLEGNYDFSKTVYFNARTIVTIICVKHGEFSINPQLITRSNKGCAICDKQSGRFPKRSLTVKQYKVLASEVHDDKYDYSLVTELNNSKKIKIICPIEHHSEFEMRHSAHISPNQQYGCPQCGNNLSRGEEAISKFLFNHKIEYITQHTLSGMTGVTGRPLRYDFYLPDHGMIIEFDGTHHFKPVKYGSRQTDEEQLAYLKRVKFYDRIKTANANLEGWDMLRIPYYDMSKIEQILTEKVLTKKDTI